MRDERSTAQIKMEIAVLDAEIDRREDEDGEMERQDILDRAADGLSDAELQDELDRARAPIHAVEPPEDEWEWRQRLHDHWIEADRRMDAEVRRAESGYLGGDH